MRGFHLILLLLAILTQMKALGSSSTQSLKEEVIVDNVALIESATDEFSG